MSTHKERSLTLNGMTGKHLLLIILSTLIVASCIYLTRHYFDVHFSSDITKTSFCDISSFWTCDSATNSPISSIFNIPISILGLLFGVMLLLGSIFPSAAFERTNSLVSKINLLGCVALFIYSFAALGSLCPVCTFYYLLSAGVAFLYFKFGLNDFSLAPKPALTYALVYLIVGGSVGYYLGNKKNATSAEYTKIQKALMDQFDSLQDLGEEMAFSDYMILQSTEVFTDAPIRISAFSDFQCPFCSKLSDYLHEFKKKYKGKMNIMYFFHPLDNNCNPGMKGQLHPQACQASYIAACSKENFNEVHDYIFANQAKIDDEWLDDYAEKLGVTECISEESTKKIVTDMFAVSDHYQVQSTPALVINGKRIDGLIPIKNFYMIFDALIARQK